MPYRDLSWWYWLATVALLAVGLEGWPVGLDAAAALCCVQIAHFASRTMSLSGFPVQLRIAYLGLLILAQWPPFHVVYWIQLIGTSTMVLFGYCLLGRTLSLLPWNRTQSLSWPVLRHTFFAPAAKGSVVPPPIGAPTALKLTCSLARPQN